MILGYTSLYIGFCPITNCYNDLPGQRDRTGAYQLADEGRIAQFPGVSAVFEEPRHVDLTLPTDRMAVAESVERVLTLLRERRFID
jgi:adenylylsulfate kinase-like enzyme